MLGSALDATGLTGSLTQEPSPGLLVFIVPVMFSHVCESPTGQRSELRSIEANRSRHTKPLVATVEFAGLPLTAPCWIWVCADPWLYARRSQ